LWLLALGRYLLVLLFAHPFFWWLRRQIRDDQEAVADAVAACESGPDYAAELLRWVRLTVGLSPVRIAAAAGLWESSSQLTKRIVILLDETFRVQTTVSRRWKYPAAGLLVLLGTAFSAVTLQPRRSAAEPCSPPGGAKEVAKGSTTAAAPFKDEPAAHALYNQMIEAMWKAKSLSYVSHYEWQKSDCTYRAWLKKPNYFHLEAEVSEESKKKLLKAPGGGGGSGTLIGDGKMLWIYWPEGRFNYGDDPETYKKTRLTSQGQRALYVVLAI
jgi:hypothetical protein